MRRAAPRLLCGFVLMVMVGGCAREAVVRQVACADPLAGCQLDDGLELRFSATPATMQKFDLYLTAPADANPSASFQMQGMEMGLNRYRLLREGGKWHAAVMLPACVRGRQDWIVRIETADGLYEVPFQSR